MTQPKMFEEGTKEELIAHFKAASKAWEYIIQGKDAEIFKLKNSINALEGALNQQKAYNGYNEVQQLRRKVDTLNQQIDNIRDSIKDLAESI